LFCENKERNTVKNPSKRKSWLNRKTLFPAIFLFPQKSHHQLALGLIFLVAVRAAIPEKFSFDFPAVFHATQCGAIHKTQSDIWIFAA